MNQDSLDRGAEAAPGLGGRDPNWPPAARFSLDDAQLAGDTWGANCGPGAIAAVCGLTLEELRPYLGDFEQKRYTNPTLMWETLGRLGVKLRIRSNPGVPWVTWPKYGLARVQWEGPWTEPGVPPRVAYRHTHWVGVCEEPGSETNIFDINCMCVGGWIPLSEWSDSLVPWLLKYCEPKANGGWHLTHKVEIERTCLPLTLASLSKPPTSAPGNAPGALSSSDGR